MSEMDLNMHIDVEFGFMLLFGIPSDTWDTVHSQVMSLRLSCVGRASVCGMRVCVPQCDVKD